MPAPASACRPSACNWSRHPRAMSTWPRASRACPRSTMAATCSTWSWTCNPRWSASAAHRLRHRPRARRSRPNHPNRSPPTVVRPQPVPPSLAPSSLVEVELELELELEKTPRLQFQGPERMRVGPSGRAALLLLACCPRLPTDVVASLLRLRHTRSAGQLLLRLRTAGLACN